MIKRKLKFSFGIISVIAFIFTSFYIFAYGSQNISVTVDGSPVLFGSAPINVSGSAMVPMRNIFEALGADVNWNGAAKTITARKNNITAQMQLGNKNIYISKAGDTKTIMSDVPPMLSEGITYVPLRSVSEIFGAELNWNQYSGKAEILTNTVLSNTKT